MKQVELWTKDNCGISESEMIAQAGKVVFYTTRSIHSSFSNPGPEEWVFVCGKGHNGADGLQAALLAAAHGYKVRVYQTISPKKGYSPESQLLHEQITKSKIDFKFFKTVEELQFSEDTCLIIEGLLGAGIQKEAKGLIAKCIQKLNQCPYPVVSIDVPSGLSTDSTQMGIHIKPIATVSLGTPKLSSLFYPTSVEYGSLYFDSLCFPEKPLRSQPSQIELFRREDVCAGYPVRPYDAHKYSTGKVLIIAGSKGMHGAAVLAAHGALKAGAGMVKLAVPAGIHPAVCQHTIEIISLAIGANVKTQKSGVTSAQDQEIGCFHPDHIKELQPVLDWADTVLIGPGLGKEPDTIDFLRKVVPKVKKNLVLDGDGLQFFCTEYVQNLKKRPTFLTRVIATPHGGEFKRMGGKYQYETPLEHINNARAIAEKYHTNVLLKGPTSLFASYQGKSVVLPSGNAGLATAGTGDVLAGILTALYCLANAETAVGVGVYIHSAAADLAKNKTGILGMTASDVLAHIPEVMASLEKDIAHAGED
jgi:NAD(P)H-hydrate epimerase